MTDKYTRGQVARMARALQFKYGKKAEILFNIDKQWFDEQLEDYDHYDEWFEKYAKECFATLSQSRHDSLRNYVCSLSGDGKLLAKFLREYDHVISNVRFIPNY